MKHVLAAVGCVCIAISVASGQPLSQGSKQLGTAEDETAIRAIVNHWQQAWSKFDASLLEGDYADDADWANAFGVRNKGSAKILAFMTAMFKRPNVQGRRTTWDEPTIRFVRPDVALVSRAYQTLGHKALDGNEMPERKTHSTWLLAKDGGKWRIVSQIISDDIVPARP
ncbi:MAG TPA: SgcJ/EcaC family oxidoreductase [Bryobacteraceae bacterium]|nr:SgcJ/EcaC family oxidoreductase [Bryobacteraceae bacterium]